MKIIFIGKELEEFESYESKAANFKQLLTSLERKLGKNNFRKLKNLNVKHIFKIKDKDEFFPITDQSQIDLNLSSFDSYFIVCNIEGNTGAETIAGLIGGGLGAAYAAGATWAIVAVYAITAVINIAIALAISAVMQLISPTPEFNKDPSDVQTRRSNLFNGALNVTNQGGSVPLIFGNPFCSSYVISSGLYTEEQSI